LQNRSSGCVRAGVRDNGGKAAFFVALGFIGDDWQTLAAASRKVAENHPVTKSMASPHSQKYILDGRIEKPSGKPPLLRTVWIADLGLDTPRLVTAYPQEE